jgi:xylobiose transport system permease protein
VSATVVDRTDRPGPLWVVPAVAFFAAFAIVPMGLVVYLSLTDWDGLGSPSFSGLDNWTRLFHDSQMLDSLKLTAILVAGSWALQTPISLLLGVWAAGTQRSRAVVVAVLFLPVLLSTAAIALLWQTLLDPNFGLAGSLGPLIGIDDGNIIGTSRGAMICLALVISWQFVPFHTLLYQAGARQIPGMLYDAAIIDGANRVQQLRRITIPLLRNTIVTSSVLMIVGSMTLFETVLILTGGGPGTATAVLPFEMYNQGFHAYQMGYASAIAVGLVVIATALSLVLVKVSGFGKMRSTIEGV